MGGEVRRTVCGVCVCVVGKGGKGTRESRIKDKGHTNCTYLYLYFTSLKHDCLGVSTVSVCTLSLSTSISYTPQTHTLFRVYSLSCSDEPGQDRLPPTLLRLRYDQTPLPSSSPSDRRSSRWWRGVNGWMDGGDRGRGRGY